MPGAAATECLVARFHTHAYAPHAHDDYVIGVVTAGHELFSIGRERGAAGAGDIILIDPGVVHDGAPAPGGYVYRMTYPGPALLALIAGEVAERPLPAPHFPKALIRDPALAARLVALHSAAEAGADRLALDQAMIGTMAAVIARHGERAGPVAAGLRRDAGREAPAVARALDYLDSHYAGTVDLATLGAVAGLPRTRLIRALRRETGLTPHAWLTDRRVKAARRLLAAGRPPADVALACGFCDQSHLNRAFKSRVGVAPGAYQRAKLG
ncbi:AraC family transcriptional regulator [Zavarzinia compransoris]|uniref:AraC family transcriptional regulator n=1 Tax=Zavarzinia compransoris TaxID=1264899 RepID=A0A317DX18_9PROT|nr:AraC family transcriptional regulator [Zavarzinia compransoris]